MTLAAICASHTPLMREAAVAASTRHAVEASFARLADRVRSFRPELVIQFSPDHFNGFFYDVMPSFCIGAAAQSVGDWGTATAPLKVPEQDALSLVTALREDGFDPALSQRMSVDHGFTQIWEAMLGRFDLYPLIPIFVNCAAPPLPSLSRVRRFGEAVGRHAARLGKRVLFVASGGLSHDPPLPDFSALSAGSREFFIAGRNPTPEMRQQREQRVRDAAILSARGEGPCRPLNPDWDHAVIDILLSGDLARADRWSDEEIRREGGRGGHEIRAWLAALAALSAAGPYRAELDFYQAIPEWIAGFATMIAEAA